MLKKYRFIPLIVLVLIGIAAIGWWLRVSHVAVLEPKGVIGHKERQLMYFAFGLSLVVVIPVFIMLFTFAWKYREGNKKAKYDPKFDHSRKLETVWWLIPTVLILILSVVTWQSSHALDPYKPIASSKKPMTIQVVSLDWKWLFIYPEQHIATVNFVQMPKDTPVTFKLTSDSVMNSFWIPELGGQMYSMPGMTTTLHLEANHAGDFQGSSANISGAGFASMRFVAHVGSDQDFSRWVQTVRRSPNRLNQATYAVLAKPGIGFYNYYSTVDHNLYDTITMKYMMPGMDVGKSMGTMQ